MIDKQIPSYVDFHRGFPYVCATTDIGPPNDRTTYSKGVMSSNEKFYILHYYDVRIGELKKHSHNHTI